MTISRAKEKRNNSGKSSELSYPFLAEFGAGLRANFAREVVYAWLAGPLGEVYITLTSEQTNWLQVALWTD